jgi:putative flippase GtrA
MDGLLRAQRNDTLAQLFRYTFVGGLAFIVDFSSLFVLTQFLKIYYLVSAAVGFLLGLALNYGLSITWVFAKRSVEKRWVEFLVFALIGVVGLALNEFFMWLFTEIFHFHYLLSKIGSTLFVYLWNFFARKFALFS